MTKEEQFVNELIGYIFAYPDDDYMTMECLCRKLFKYGLIEKKDGEWTTDFILVPVLRKDEPTISKMEQVDKDINVRSKGEPQTNADQHVQHVGSVESVEPTWTKEEHEAFYTFLWNVINPNEMQDYIEMFETKTEPQTERSE